MDEVQMQTNCRERFGAKRRQSSRYLGITCIIVVGSGLLCAQTESEHPQPDSTILIEAYMRFHVSLARVLARASAKDAVATAARESLGLSPREFDFVTERCQSALAAYSANTAPQSREIRDRALASAFKDMFAHLSPQGAASVKAFMNGPFRKQVRILPIRGGLK